MRLVAFAALWTLLAAAAPAGARANTYAVDLPGPADAVLAPDDLWLAHLSWESSDPLGAERVEITSDDGGWRPLVESAGAHGRAWSGAALPDRTRGARIAGDGVLVHALRAQVVDEHAPTASGISGSLTTGGQKSGTVSVSASARDRGSGLRYVKLGVDGRFHGDDMRLVDGNGGRCTHAGSPYSAAAPCVLAAEDTATLDTTRLADGPHEIEYLLQDAAGNLTTAATWAVVINNPGGALPDTACANGLDDDGDGAVDRGADPGCLSASDTAETHDPVATAPPDVTGAPAVGATLTATPGSWDDGPGASPTTAHRWQVCDDGGCRDITDATGKTLEVRAELAGGRIRVLEDRATSEGRGSALSATTSRVATPPAPLPSAPEPESVIPPAAGPPAPAAPTTAVLEIDGGCGAVLTGRRSAIGGRLRTDRGAPLAGVIVVVEERRLDREAWRAMRLARPVVTDAAGRFTVVPTAKGGHAIRIRHADAVCEIAVVARAIVILGAERARTGAVLAGRVAGARLPPEGARVVLEARSAKGWKPLKRLRTGRDGTFQLRYRGDSRTFRARVEATRGAYLAPVAGAPVTLKPR